MSEIYWELESRLYYEMTSLFPDFHPRFDVFLDEMQNLSEHIETAARNGENL